MHDSRQTASGYNVVIHDFVIAHIRQINYLGGVKQTTIAQTIRHNCTLQDVMCRVGADNIIQTRCQCRAGASPPVYLGAIKQCPQGGASSKRTTNYHLESIHKVAPSVV